MKKLFAILVACGLFGLCVSGCATDGRPDYVKRAKAAQEAK